MGRRAELGRLDALLEAARGGSTTSVVFEGEPGIGKTTMLLAAARRAVGFRCLWARGVESEAVLAHAGLLQALGPLRAELAEIPSAQAAALSVAVGWEPPGAPTDRFLVAAAVLSLIAAEARRAPVLVLVDDLQWVDRESASALAFAARRLRDDPVCFVWAGRSGQLPADVVLGLPVARARPADADGRPCPARGIGSRIGSPIAWWPTRVAIRWRCSRSRSDSRTRSGSGRRRCPRRRPSATDSCTCTGSSLGGLSAPARRAVLLTALNRSGSSATVAAALTREELDVAAALDEATDLGVLVRSGGELGSAIPCCVPRP